MQIVHRVGIASVSRKGRRSVGNISPQVSVHLVRVCVRQLSSQISFVDGSEKRSGDRERITVRGDRAGQGLFEQVVIQSAATAARRWAGSIRADACNAEKVQLCRDHPPTVNRLNFEGFIPNGLIQLGRGIEVAGMVYYSVVGAIVPPFQIVAMPKKQPL